MFSILSLVTSIKDYVEVVHKLIESDSNYNIQNYNDFGAIVSYLVLTGKQFFLNFLSFHWLQQIPTLPYLVPDIASAMISEISVFDGNLHNALSLVEKPISYGEQNLFFSSLEKFSIGFINSLLVFLPTSTASLITLRRFVVQGIEAGYLSGLGTLLGSLLWIASYLFGWRFLVLPWLSLDVLRHSIGLILLVKYMWDTYTERRMILEDLSKVKIFLLTFLLAFTEQTSLFPFLSNISLGSDTTILESFPSTHISSFFIIHGSYILGLGLGGFSLLQLTCWFWENPAFRLYTWALSAVKIQSRVNLKFFNFIFLYLTMISAMSNLVYFGLDYTLTKPFGLVPNDRLIDQKVLLETSFLGTKASDRNTRLNLGRRGRRERWKKSVERYRTFDASLYGEGIYDLFTIEDLNYGFDRFWLRRKIRNHDVPFRLFPGPWVRSFKKQLSRPRLESFSGPRFEFFRILFEQVYHPTFHEKKAPILVPKIMGNAFPKKVTGDSKEFESPIFTFPQKERDSQKRKLDYEFSVFQKFVRKAQKRVQTSKIAFELKNSWKLIPDLQSQEIGMNNFKSNLLLDLEKQTLNPIYSKRWKMLFSNWKHRTDSITFKKTNSELRKSLLFEKNVDFQLTNLKEKAQKFSFEKNQVGTSLKDRALSASQKLILNNFTQSLDGLPPSSKESSESHLSYSPPMLTKKWNFERNQGNQKKDFENLLSKKDRQILKYKSFLFELNSSNNFNSILPFSNDEKNLNLSHSAFKKPKQTDNFKNKLTNCAENETLNKIHYKPMTLFHPIRFYLHKEKAFKRKFKFYGATLFRNFGVSNNSPYFRITMKKFFYYYKPTLRWERTMRAATVRKIRRKGPRQPFRLNLSSWSPDIWSKNQSVNTDSAKALLTKADLSKNQYSTDPNDYWQEGIKNEDKNLLALDKQSQNLNSEKLKKVHHNFEGLQKPTHMYSLIGKRASRYRYQIYKDVLQHWYYSPFNRFLLKLDIDAFIRRQPSAHFLTTNEESLLNLRRNLLFDHYESLRWYTYMQHYRSMKAHIGGTKSFSSRFYNQQFQGTFQKIRHLFSVTPILSQNQAWNDGAPSSYLKWDQALYHEHPNNVNFSILNDSLLHEELLTELPIKNSEDLNSSSQFSSENLLEESQRVLGTYLIQARPIRQKMISQYLQEKKYWELTRFLLKGQKLRGTEPVTNFSSFLKQEKEYLYTNKELEDLHQQTRKELKQLIEEGKVKENLWMSFIKKSQKTIYDRKSFKNYLKKKVEIQETSKKIRQKQLKDRLDRIQNWLVVNSDNAKLTSPETGKFLASSSNSRLEAKKHIASKNVTETPFALQTLSSGIRKAIKEGMQMQENVEDSTLFGLSNKYFNGSTKFKRPLWRDPILKSDIQSKTNLYFQNHTFKKQTKIFKQNFENSLLNIESLIEKNRNISSTAFLNIQRFQKKVFSSIFKMRNRSLIEPSNLNSPFFEKIQILMQNLFTSQSMRTKGLSSWKQKQHVLEKRRQTRKVLKALKKQVNRENSRFDNLVEDFKNLETFSSQNMNIPLQREKTMDHSNREPTDFSDKNQRSNRHFFLFSPSTKEPWNVLNFTKDFQTKRSRRRGVRLGRNRGAIKKPSLNDKLKRQFKILKRYGKKMDNQKIEFQLLREESENEFHKSSPKQRRTRQRENRFWQKHKKQKYNTTRREMKKRKRLSIGKIRNLEKELKRVQSQVQIRKWWWQSFLPDFRANIDQFFQISKDRNIHEKLQSLSSSEILSRDSQSLKTLNESLDFKNNSTIPTSNEETRLLSSLQIGDYDYKPLSMPQTLWIRKQFKKASEKSNESIDSNLNVKEITDLSSEKKFFSKNVLELSNIFNKFDFASTNQEALNASLFLNSTIPQEKNSQFIKNFHPMPFYAGWDESLRKFIVTTRLLSRRDAGYKIPIPQSLETTRFQKKELFGRNFSSNEKQEANEQFFSLYPLKGINVATTLYWQIPFTTYDPDQFFALGRDGFAPIGWRRFSFSSAKQSIKPIIVQTKTVTTLNQFSNSDKFLKPGIAASVKIADNLKEKLLRKKLFVSNNELQKQEGFIQFTQKRNKRIKRHPRSPVSFPSGPLIHQVLPVHYIYIFYKRDRLPRDRYISRRLRKAKDGPSFAMQQSLLKSTDWTLRKRVKTRRRYHRTRRDNSNQLAFPKSILRRQFRSKKSTITNSYAIDMTRQRPMSKAKLTSGLEDRLKERYKQRKRNASLKLKGENLRIRQLRRRIQRQVFRPVWRYQPHPGGFVWPGDYLRLEFIKAPRLKEEKVQIFSAPLSKEQGTSVNESINIRRKAPKKKKRNIQSWQIQPKKFLIQKHNRKVLKKRLQKAQNHHKLKQKVKELESFIF